MFGGLVMRAQPALPDGMHAVGPARHGGGSGAVARRAIDEDAVVTLQARALEIVVDVRRGVLGVRRPMARLACETPMAAGEPVEREARRGSVRIRCEGGVDGLPVLAGRDERRRVADGSI